MIDFPLTNEDVHHVNAEWSKIVPAGKDFIQSPEPLSKLSPPRLEES
jgi:hypothetical protein